MPTTELTNGNPVPDDNSHTEIQSNGMQKEYVVLSKEERSKGYVKPLRYNYLHNICGTVTSMSSSIAETYARNPYFYNGTFCSNCRAHFELTEFTWEDGEPMNPLLQEDWHKSQAVKTRQGKLDRLAKFKEEIASIEKDLKSGD